MTVEGSCGTSKNERMRRTGSSPEKEDNFQTFGGRNNPFCVVLNGGGWGGRSSMNGAGHAGVRQGERRSTGSLGQPVKVSTWKHMQTRSLHISTFVVAINGTYFVTYLPKKEIKR